jgi:lipid II isoglutaminyl synthase (glutamine-hydrolysing)
MSNGDRLSIALLYPTVLGLYGDRGNASVLAHRAKARDIDAEILVIDPGTPVPEHADMYLLGGGEDIAQTTGCELLRADGGLARAHARDAVIFAVCAGMQILGTSFPADGRIVSGLGLLDIVTTPGSPRAVGELLTEAVGVDVPTMTGYENHGGRSRLGPSLKPLGRVVVGIGNGVDDGGCGARPHAGHLHARPSTGTKSGHGRPLAGVGHRKGAPANGGAPRRCVTYGAPQRGTEVTRSDTAAERVTVVHVAASEAVLEPVHALGR